MRYTVMVADNARYMDGNAHHEHGAFATQEGAVAACKRIVDAYLTSAQRPGMSAQALFMSFTRFGEDPYIVSSYVDGVAFSAWDYARGRCAVLCAP